MCHAGRVILGIPITGAHGETHADQLTVMTRLLGRAFREQSAEFVNDGREGENE